MATLQMPSQQLKKLRNLLSKIKKVATQVLSLITIQLHFCSTKIKTFETTNEHKSARIKPFFIFFDIFTLII